jgi:hypothetical protein
MSRNGTVPKGTPNNTVIPNNTVTPNNTAIPGCKANSTTIYENCKIENFSYMQKKRSMLAYANETAPQLPNFFEACVEKEDCTIPQLKDLFNNLCPEALKLYNCFGEDLKCLNGSNDTIVQHLNRFKSDCNTVTTTNNTNTTDNDKNQGFTFTMPWSLLLVFLV